MCLGKLVGLENKMGHSLGEQGDNSQGGTNRHKSLKKKKVKIERKKAKENPEVQPGYKKYRGYEL